MEISDIAVIGIACRVPGCDGFLENLCGGVELIVRLSEDEMQPTACRIERFWSPGYVGAGGVLDRLNNFDAGFVGHSAREAELTDLPHRLSWSKPGSVRMGRVGSGTFRSGATSSGLRHFREELMPKWIDEYYPNQTGLVWIALVTRRLRLDLKQKWHASGPRSSTRRELGDRTNFSISGDTL